MYVLTYMWCFLVWNWICDGSIIVPDGDATFYIRNLVVSSFAHVHKQQSCVTAGTCVEQPLPTITNVGVAFPVASVDVLGANVPGLSPVFMALVFNIKRLLNS